MAGKGWHLMATIINGKSYTDFDDIVELSGISALEMAEIKLRTQIIGELIKARNGAGITQKELEAISGVSQPLIARIEKGKTDPQITTILRMLDPLGMTLAIVPKPKEHAI
jgi:DNA-binding XRE family transcriptional regulator